MSQLKIFTADDKEFRLNVTQFKSPMNAQITSAQTKTMLHHFPIRCGQPDINFTVRYASMDDKHAFEGWVRTHQVNTRQYSQKEPQDITLWWPERNIENWTGYILNYVVAEKRFESAPAANFGVALTDSMMSERTTVGSRGVSVWKILGLQIPEFRGYDDTILIPPVRSDAQTPINPQDRVGALNSGDAPPAIPQSPAQQQVESDFFVSQGRSIGR